MTPADGPGAEAPVEERPTLDELYRRHSGWLTAILRRRFDPQQAEDLMQETYVRLGPYQARGEVRHPKGLLLRIAENLAYNQARGARRDRRRVDRLAEVSRCHEHYTDAEQHQALLFKQVVEALPQPLRDTFMMSRYAGMTYGEIAKHCGLSQKAVESRMSKALALIAARMRD
jgi:RNA polymerase sigma factor (sigma-70 family)